MRATGEERLVERLVTYTLETDGHLVVIEHVPARINEETGERYYAPATVEKLQQIIRERRKPERVIEAPVFDFAA
jgi:macrodomain Ter protein organizer (MatP/YcbG family)